MPEPMVMEEDSAVVGFEQASRNFGGLAVTYHLSAHAISNWLPEGGQVVDVGCGPGTFPLYLAERRPDCHVLGIDLSGRMVAHANDKVQAANLNDRLAVVQGDATNLPDGLLPEHVDVLSCLNMLHQLPDVATLDGCLTQFARLRDRYKCAIWLLDLVRFRHSDTFSGILGIVGRDMGREGIRLAVESEAAAFTVSELRQRLEARGLGDLRVGRDAMPGLLQLHWAPPGAPVRPATDQWVADSLPLWARIQVRLFRGLPPPASG